MSFKLRLLSLAILAAVSGCSLYEGPPAPRKDDFSQGNLGCLKDFNAKLVAYFDGRSSIDDVNRLAECSKTALRTFGNFVRGENRDRFTAQEIRNFIQEYFLDDMVVSDGLLRELMRVKQALVGGKETDFTAHDLKEAEVLLDVFRDILVQLQPSMPLSIARVKSESVAYVDAEARAIARVGEIFGERITQKDSTYSFDEMGRLFDEIVRAFPGAAGTLGNLREQLKTAGVLKEVLISPDRPRGTVTAAEWRIIFQDGSRWLANFLKYLNLQGKSSDLTRGKDRARLSDVVGESIDLLERVVSRHCPKGRSTVDGCSVAPAIPFELLQEMMENIDWDGTIAGVKFKKSSLEAILPSIFRRFFSGTNRSVTGRLAKGVTVDHLNHLRVLKREWIDGARYVEGLYAKLTRSPDFSDEAMVSTTDIDGANVREVLALSGEVTEEAYAVAEGLRQTFSKTVALLDRGSPTILFDGKNKSRGRIYREMVRYTWLKPLMKLATLGYMEGPAVPNREKHPEVDGLTRPEFEQMIRDYWQLLIDFKLVGRRNTVEGDAKKRFREAALFTQSSDGNDLISIEEGVQIVLYMFSARPMGGEVHDRAMRLCRNGPIDDYGEPTIEPTCYRRIIFDFGRGNREMADLWTPFPVLIQFYESLDADEREEFGESIERAIRKPGVKKNAYFGSDDSDAVPMLFHYIEALFMVYDTNARGDGVSGDGFIDRSEGEIAFPTFKNVLAEYAGRSADNKYLPAVFDYLIAKGEKPSLVSVLWWKKFKPSYKSDRLLLMKVFATISSSSK